MIKQLIQTTLLSLNILNAPTNREIKKAENTEPTALYTLTFFNITTINNKQPTLSQYYDQTATIYKDNERITYFSAKDEDLTASGIKYPNNPNLSLTFLFDNINNKYKFNKVEYNFTIETEFANYSGWQNTTQETQAQGIIKKDNKYEYTPIRIKTTIESEYISGIGEKNLTSVTLTQEFYQGNNKINLYGANINSTQWIKIKGGTQQNPDSEEPNIPITPENPSGETDNYYGEIIDLPSLIFTIISLPFTFITQAFNLTIFKGTPYELNFANVISLIIGGLILIYIIKMIMQLKG